MALVAIMDNPLITLAQLRANFEAGHYDHLLDYPNPPKVLYDERPLPEEVTP